MSDPNDSMPTEAERAAKPGKGSAESLSARPARASRSWAVAAVSGGSGSPKIKVNEGLELFESAPTDESGYEAWQAEREATRRAFEKRWGIPLKKRVRIQLRGEPREREGLLLAVEEPKGRASKSLRLRLGTFVFQASQIESVSRV